MLPTSDQRAAWLQRAITSYPQLNTRRVLPIALVKPVEDSAAWQGWRMEPCGAPETLPSMRLRRGATVLLDLGEHLVGQPELDLSSAGCPPDSPLRLRIRLAELPSEAAEPDLPQTGGLSRAWLQDEIVTIDEIPCRYRLPRRLAGRWLALEVVDTSPNWDLVVQAVRFLAVTGATHELPPSPPGLTARQVAIDQVALRTLRNCMQTVFEDGPKRDRRLWTGDLRLQLLTDGVAFRRRNIAERSLCLLGAFTRASDGAFPACCYERPEPHPSVDVISDYCLTLPALLRDLLRQGSDRTLVSGFALLARQQIAIGLGWLGGDGTVVVPQGWWTFIDWQDKLDKRAALHGVLCWAMEAWLGLAADLGLDPGDDAAVARRLQAAGRAVFWDAQRGRAHSDGQASWATAAWLVMGGVLSGREAQSALESTLDDPEAVRPGGPYLMHHVVHALFIAGLHERAWELLDSFWGGMVDRGAETFWEVYDPRQPRWSPYRDHRLNSACHAWSCTPAWFLRAPSERITAPS